MKYVTLLLSLVSLVLSSLAYYRTTLPPPSDPLVIQAQDTAREAEGWAKLASHRSYCAFMHTRFLKRKAMGLYEGLPKEERADANELDRCLITPETGL